MVYKPILIVAGEPNSIFSEIFFKSIKYKKYKSPIIIIASKKLIELQMRKLNVNKKIRLIDFLKIGKYNFDNRKINLIDVNFDQKKPFKRISNKSNAYIEKSFEIAIQILNTKITNKFINGPVSKKSFLKKKFPGITEYLSKKTNSENEVMLIYNNKFSVSPITTHLPLKKVAKEIKKDKICKNIINLNNFYCKVLKKTPRFALLGLNPHCETIDNFSEEENIIIPSIKSLKKRGINVSGPFSADTFFIKKNLDRYNIVIGMYHDQVLSPIKTLFEYDAINITLGLPFVRISPDHGPNEKMLGKNVSSPLSYKS
jgi:4-hydroxythreonine-4-phosphate dehydrogenase